MSKSSGYAVGDRLWIPDKEEAWLAGIVQKITPTSFEFSTEKGIVTIEASKSNPKLKFDECGSHVDGNFENLVDLDELSEGAIIHHVRKRYQKRLIYTFVGSILVAMNPFEKLKIYGNDDIRQAQYAINSYPHIFMTSSIAYKQLKNNNKSQSVLISGESGAGKTETTKKVLSYLASVASNTNNSNDENNVGIEEKILQSNPLLEALGNAKTLRNNNSSRFGKYMSVYFNKSHQIKGCNINNYLLEKSRVITQNKDERNYHIFYQLLQTTNPTYKKHFQLQPAAAYNYLSQSGCYSITNVNDSNEFADVINAMKTLAFSDELIYQVFQLLSFVLTLGNVVFKDGDIVDDDENGINIHINKSNQSTLLLCSELLQVDLGLLYQSLTEKLVQMGKASLVKIKLTSLQANDARDALAKSLYSNLFDYIIKLVNITLRTMEMEQDGTLNGNGGAESGMECDRSGSGSSISILDIFGFEVFPVNSFEQLCINYANEKLQLHFNTVIFHEETKMYVEEGISLDKIKFEDNALCVALIESKPFGILSLLDEECSLGKATDITFINKLEKTFNVGNNKTYNPYFVKHRLKQELFTVKHFAGAVEYNVATSFLDKNRDQLSGSMLEMIQSSQSNLVQSLYSNSNDNSNGNSKTNNNKVTLGGQFRNQLIGLIASINQTEPHFVRCVKPNGNKLPMTIDSELTLRQLRYAGLFEAIRIRKSGYAYRAPHAVFLRVYDLLYPNMKFDRQQGMFDNNMHEACSMILELMEDQGVLPPDCWVVGRTKVFLKANEHRLLLNRRLADSVTSYVVTIQKTVRSYYVRKKFLVVRDAWRFEKNKHLIMEKIANIAAIIIQKNIRRYLTLNSYVFIRDLIKLRLHLKRRNIEHAKLLMYSLEEQVKLLRSDFFGQQIGNGNNNSINSKFLSYSESKSNKNSKLKDKSLEYVPMEKYIKEIMLCKSYMKIFEVQDSYLLDVKIATESRDVLLLNQLLSKAEKLDLVNHEVVIKGTKELYELYQKKKVLEYLIKFLNNELSEEISSVPLDMFDDVDLDDKASDARAHVSGHRSQLPQMHISNIIEKAKMYQINPELVSKVERVYYASSPRIQIRNRLRLAIEAVDYDGILKAMEDVEQVRRSTSHFADVEMRAAEMMLKLIHYENEIKEMSSSSGNTTGSHLSHPVDRGRRLSKEMLVLCDQLALSETKQNHILYQNIKNKLNHLVQDKEELETVLRSYKWAKTLAVWKFPEIQNANNRKTTSSDRHSSSNGDEIFYGYNITRSRASSYLIRLLHGTKEVAGVPLPPSVQAGIGALDLPVSISQTLIQFNEIEKQNKLILFKLNNIEKTGIIFDLSSPKKGSAPSPVPMSSPPSVKIKSPVQPSNSPFATLESQLLQSRRNIETQKKLLQETKKRGIASSRVWK